MSRKRIAKPAMVRAFGEAKVAEEWLQDPRCTAPTLNTLLHRIRQATQEAKGRSQKRREAAIERAITYRPPREEKWLSGDPPITAFGEAKTVDEWFGDNRCRAESIVALCENLQKVLLVDHSSVEEKQAAIEKAIATGPGTGAERQEGPRLWIAFGDRKTVEQWYDDPRRHPSLRRDTLEERLRKGMNAEEAITKPAQDWCQMGQTVWVPLDLPAKEGGQS